MRTASGRPRHLPPPTGEQAIIRPPVVLFWLCALAVAYSYLIYPLVVYWSSRWGRSLARPGPVTPEEWPRVSLLLAAHNEEEVLADRLRNALAMDYPADRLEIVVGSDGSTDATGDIARGFADRGVRLIEFGARRGKAAVLNDAIPSLSGEVVLLSDANTVIDPAAARSLARWFERADISSVCGRLVLIDPSTGANADGIYWKYETFLKRCEARLGALLGANGAIYAIRKDRYVPLPEGIIIDDFLIPLLIRLRHGGASLYEPEAVAWEETSPDIAAEFRRRCRIGAGGFQSLGLLWPLLDPRRGWVAFAFFSHKVLRWFCPFFLIGMLAGNLALLDSTAWRWAMAAQLCFYGASYLVPPSPSRLLRPLRLATMFTSMNVALLVGFWRWYTGRQGGTWTPTSRAVTPSEVRR